MFTFPKHACVTTPAQPLARFLPMKQRETFLSISVLIFCTITISSLCNYSPVLTPITPEFSGTSPSTYLSAILQRFPQPQLQVSQAELARAALHTMKPDVYCLACPLFCSLYYLDSSTTLSLKKPSLHLGLTTSLLQLKSGPSCFPFFTFQTSLAKPTRV